MERPPLIVDDYDAIAAEYNRLFKQPEPATEELDLFETVLDELLLAEFTDDDIRSLLAA